MCGAEFDVFEGNSISTAFTAHPCSIKSPKICEGIVCGDNPAHRYDGCCDKDGCDFAPYRLGAKDFYGPKKTVDTDKKFTVVTQFITDNGLSTGKLTEIRRLYVQDGQVIPNPKSTFPSLKTFDSITEPFCKAQKTLFGDKNDFSAKGGLASMGDAMDRGMVLTMSLWDDHDVDMLWLDSNYPLNKPATSPGVSRGTCDAASGKPKFVEDKYPDAWVEYSNIKIGDIGSTYANADSTAAGPTKSTPTEPVSPKPVSIKPVSPKPVSPERVSTDPILIETPSTEPVYSSGKHLKTSHNKSKKKHGLTETGTL